MSGQIQRVPHQGQTKLFEIEACRDILRNEFIECISKACIAIFYYCLNFHCFAIILHFKKFIHAFIA